MALLHCCYIRVLPKNLSHPTLQNISEVVTYLYSYDKSASETIYIKKYRKKLNLIDLRLAHFSNVITSYTLIFLFVGLNDLNWL